MTEFGIAEAKARFSEMTRLVDAGEEVVITRHREPLYRLSRATESRVEDLPKYHPSRRVLPDFAALRAMTKPSDTNAVVEMRKLYRY